jgi:hypothetical protein
MRGTHPQTIDRLQRAIFVGLQPLALHCTVQPLYDAAGVHIIIIIIMLPIKP